MNTGFIINSKQNIYIERIHFFAVVVRGSEGWVDNYANFTSHFLYLFTNIMQYINISGSEEILLIMKS
jgi:hypothetical protein